MMGRFGSSERTGPGWGDSERAGERPALGAGRGDGLAHGEAESAPLEPDWTRPFRDEPVLGFNSRGWQLGREDASVGQGTAAAERAIRAAVEFYWYRRLTRARQLVQGKRVEIQALSVRRTELADKVQVLRDLRACAGAQPDLPPVRGFWDLSGWLYLGAGAVAIGAEFSLAAAMARAGFSSHREGAALKSITWGTDLALVATLCLLLGFTFKLVLDGLHGELGRVAMGKPTGTMRVVGKRRLFFRLVEIGLFVLCAGTVWSAAELRTTVDRKSFLLTKEGELAVAKQREQVELLAAGGQALAQGTGALGEDSATARLKRIRAEMDDVERRQERAAGQTLRLLAFTAPMFAALCLFTGLRVLGARAQDRRIHGRQARLEADIVDIDRKLLAAEAVRARAQQRIDDDLEHEAAIKNARFEAELAFYQHGYSRGRALPADRPSDRGVYDLHVQALKRLGKLRIFSRYATDAKRGEPT